MRAANPMWPPVAVGSDTAAVGPGVGADGWGRVATRRTALPAGRSSGVTR